MMANNIGASLLSRCPRRRLREGGVAAERAGKELGWNTPTFAQPPALMRGCSCTSCYDMAQMRR